MPENLHLPVESGKIFDVCMIDHELYHENDTCPHQGCGSNEGLEMVDYFMFRVDVRGDLYRCQACHQLTFVVDAPELHSDYPVVTTWTVPDSVR